MEIVRPRRARMLLRASSAVDEKLMSAAVLLHLVDDLIGGRIVELADNLAVANENDTIGV